MLCFTKLHYFHYDRGIGIQIQLRCSYIYSEDNLTMTINIYKKNKTHTNTKTHGSRCCACGRVSVELLMQEQPGNIQETDNRVIASSIENEICQLSLQRKLN